MLRIQDQPVEFHIEEESVYRVGTFVEYSDSKTPLTLYGLSDSSEQLLKRTINKSGYTSTILFSKNGHQKLIIKANTKFKHGKVEVSIEKLGSTKKSKEIETNSKTKSAAIATYPGRADALPHTINSLINQVDYLFIYLNEYNQVPDFIEKHPQRKRIVVIVDEEGSRRAEAKLHWANRINGYYFTCDDDIIYPSDYVEATVKALDNINRKGVVGYHGIVFNSSVASFKGDRKEFYRFSESLEEVKVVNLLGTGVCAFHTDLLVGVDTTLLAKFPYAVDPAFAVICKANNIPMYCLEHKENWLESSPYMMYGLHEEKQFFQDKKLAVDKLMYENNPWGHTRTYWPVALLKKNRKFRKLLNNPKQFFKDSVLLKSINPK